MKLTDTDCINRIIVELPARVPMKDFSIVKISDRRYQVVRLTGGCKDSIGYVPNIEPTKYLYDLQRFETVTKPLPWDEALQVVHFLVRDGDDYKKADAERNPKTGTNKEGKPTIDPIMEQVADIIAARDERPTNKVVAAIEKCGEQQLYEKHIGPAIDRLADELKY